MKKVKRAAAGAKAPARQQVWMSDPRRPPDPVNIAYCAGRDVAVRPMADADLIPFDLWQNRAHLLMLVRQGIVSKADAARIAAALTKFETQVSRGALELDPAAEDVHTNIEKFVRTQEGPAIAGQLHTGRSRNDQTTTVVRLYLRQHLLDSSGHWLALVRSILRRAKEFAATPTAGYTHYQPGCITTVGHWFASHAQALLRDVERLLDAAERANISPLGAAAAFGTSWPIDRPLTAELLGFRDVQRNTLDCITTRWEMEAEAVGALAFAMTHLSIAAQDLLFLGHPYVGVLRLPEEYTTGSSIMPQKRNPDFAEVTRAKAAIIQQQWASLMSIARGSLSGYNRDTQWTKYLLMDAVHEAAAAPVVFAGVYDGLEVDAARGRELAQRDFVDAVDVADSLALSAGLSFRESYDIVSRAVKSSRGLGRITPDALKAAAAVQGVKVPMTLQFESPEAILLRKKHTGGPAPVAVRADVAVLERTSERLAQRLVKMRAEIQEARTRTARLLSDLKRVR